MAYRLSRKAADDLRHIYVTGTIAFGVEQAEDYFAGLERTFAFLADHPRAARERTELPSSSRAYRYQAHLIFYRLDGPNILIQRVRHGREDWITR